MTTENKQLVGVQGDSIVILAPKNRMTRDEALAHAAWIVVLAENQEHRFVEYCDAIQS